MAEFNNIFSLSDNFFNNNNDLKTKDDFVKEITPTIESILKLRFPESQIRQRVKVYSDRINFACPICGDSASSNSKKRGNIILDGNYAYKYKCHNCGAFMSIKSFLSRFNQTMNLSMIDYVVDNTPKNISSVSTDTPMNMLFNIKDIDDYGVSRETLKQQCSLIECNTPSYVNSYLIQRLQYNFNKFLYEPRYQLLFVLNLTLSGKIIGIQVRSLAKNFKGPKYKTYNLSNIYKLLLKTEVNIPEDINTLSMIFNILLIDYNKPVIVVEGPMDSFLLNNCIALCGANKHPPININYKYLFDDDDTGRKNAIKQLEQGSEVFLWSKFKCDMNLPKRKKWDINDVYIYCKQNNIQIKNIYKYFSSDILDILEI